MKNETNQSSVTTNPSTPRARFLAGKYPDQYNSFGTMKYYSSSDPERQVRGAYVELSQADQDDPIVIAHLESELARIAAQKQAAHERKLAELSARQEAGERKSAQIAAWVEANGTASQRERQAAGVLPEDEAVAAIRADAFAPLSGWPRYERLAAANLACECGEAKFEVGDSADYSDDEWALRKKILAALPAAEVTLRVHTGVCQADDCDEQIERRSLYVSLTVGEIRFSREFSTDLAEVSDVPSDAAGRLEMGYSRARDTQGQEWLVITARDQWGQIRGSIRFRFEMAQKQEHLAFHRLVGYSD